MNESTTHKPTWLPLVCTRCGADLYIELRDEGSSWQSYRVIDCISCEKCGAEWDPNGQPQPTTWLAELEHASPTPGKDDKGDD